MGDGRDGMTLRSDAMGGETGQRWEKVGSSIMHVTVGISFPGRSGTLLHAAVLH